MNRKISFVKFFRSLFEKIYWNIQSIIDISHIVIEKPQKDHKIVETIHVYLIPTLIPRKK